MKTSEFVEQVIIAARRDHKVRKTWQCYGGWARRYAQWLRLQPSLHTYDSETKLTRLLVQYDTDSTYGTGHTTESSIIAMDFVGDLTLVLTPASLTFI